MAIHIAPSGFAAGLKGPKSVKRLLAKDAIKMGGNAIKAGVSALFVSLDDDDGNGIPEVTRAEAGIIANRIAESVRRDIEDLINTRFGGS